MCGVFSTLHPRYITTSGAGDAFSARAFACAGRVTRETNSAGSWSRESTLTPRDMTPNAFCPAARRSASAFARFSSSRVIASMKRGFTPSSQAVRQAPGARARLRPARAATRGITVATQDREDVGDDRARVGAVDAGGTGGRTDLHTAPARRAPREDLVDPCAEALDERGLATAHGHDCTAGSTSPSNRSRRIAQGVSGSGRRPAARAPRRPGRPVRTLGHVVVCGATSRARASRTSWCAAAFASLRGAIGCGLRRVGRVRRHGAGTQPWPGGSLSYSGRDMPP